jgi:catechol 2,3-dioxygenase-like lactoylglutathione lyase family enzyme
MRTHISLNVRNVDDSVAFYEKLFGARPPKRTAAYAKFDLEAPSLNFAVQSDAGEISRVSHFGIEVDSTDEMMRWQKRLTEQGLVKLVESNTSCCFALQDKVWLADPDGNAWEIFYVREQLPVTETAATSACCSPTAAG